MNCTLYRTYASLSIDDALTATQQEAFDRHIQTCAACRAYAEELRKQKDACALLEQVQVPPNFSGEWQAQLQQKPAQTRLTHLRVWASVAAAALVVGLGFMAFRGQLLQRTPNAASQSGGVVKGALYDGAQPAAQAPQAESVALEEQIAADEAMPEPLSGAGSIEAAPVAPQAAPREAPQTEAGTSREFESEDQEDTDASLPDSRITLFASGTGSALSWLQGYASDNGITLENAGEGFIAALSQAQFDALKNAWIKQGGTFTEQYVEGQSTYIQIKP